MGAEHAVGLDIGTQAQRDPRAAPAKVPGRETRTQQLAESRAQILANLVEHWRAAGLLDAPFRPADVGAFPPIAAPVATVQPVPALARVTPEVEAPPTTRPAPKWLPPPALIAFAVFALVLLWPNKTAPAWMDERSPITGAPYGSEAEYRWTWQLSAKQRDYLRFLLQALDAHADASVDGESDPLAVAQPNRKRAQCEAKQVPRRGGHKVHDAYATKVSGSPFDYWVRSGTDAINYDGLETPLTVWEVKTGYMWFFNPSSIAITKATLLRWEVQRIRGVRIALACGYVHRWAHHDPHMVNLMNTMWRGVPPVEWRPL